MLGIRRPGGMEVEAERVQILLAHHVVEVDAGARHDHARALAVGARARCTRARRRRAPRCAWSNRAARRGSARGSPPRRAPRGTRACARTGPPPSRDDHAQRRRLRAAIQQRQRVGQQRAARRRRRVGEDLAIAIAHPHRLALERLVAGEVPGAQRAAARPQPVAHRGRHVSPVEGLDALAPETLERVGELRVAQQLALASTALRRPQRGALGRGGEQVGEDLRHVGLPRVQHHALAREPRRRRHELLERTVPQRSTAAHTPAGAPYTPQEAGPMWKTCAASPNDTSIA